MREDTFGLAAQPGARLPTSAASPSAAGSTSTSPRRSLALARAGPRDCTATRAPGGVAEEADRARAEDEQDAALFVVAAFTGLRMGELLALRWRNVDFADAKLVVGRAGQPASVDASPKSRKCARRPARRPAAGASRPTVAARATSPAATTRVLQRRRATTWTRSALRRRYRRAPDAAGLRPLRFHDLRHSFGSLVIREFDLASVKDFMGHAKITTTERYLHARSAARWPTASPARSPASRHRRRTGRIGSAAARYEASRNSPSSVRSSISS